MFGDVDDHLKKWCVCCDVETVIGTIIKPSANIFRVESIVGHSSKDVIGLKMNLASLEINEWWWERKL